MLLFLYGSDTYRSFRKLQEIISHYQQANSPYADLVFFDFQQTETQFHDFQNALQTTSLFGGKKLLVLKNALKSEAFKKSFLKQSSQFLSSPQLMVFCEKEKVSPQDPLFKFLSQNARCQEFKTLKGKDLERWAKKEFEKYGAQIEPNALPLLIEYTGNDLWRLSNEIQKLSNYRPNLKKSDILLLVPARVETNIFKTIDLVAQKEKGAALALIHQHLEKGDSALYLLSMVAFQFRNLLLVKEQTRSAHSSPYLLSRKLGIHPFVARKSQGLASKFSFEELKKIYRQITRLDLEIKSGKIEPELALELLIARI